jgi:hypothetical protein
LTGAKEGQMSSAWIAAGRRRFLQRASLGAVAVAAVGCASVSPRPAAARVVIIGAGWGGVSTARADQKRHAVCRHLDRAARPLHVVPAVGALHRSIDARRRVLATSIGDLRYQMANPVLPMQAPALIRDAGLGQRWAEVRMPYFLSAADQHVYVIGDATGLPFPKSGHVAFETGQLVARHIAERVRPAAGGAAPAMPGAICWAFMSEKEAIGIHVSAAWEPGAAPRLQIKVDPAKSAPAAEGAMQWGRSVWSAMLG